MNTVYLSLGANQGKTKETLERAIKSLEAIPECRVIEVSSYYVTPAWGKVDQDDFLNLACKLETNLTAQEFLEACQKIEYDLGRVRHEKWGPRTIDIDLLLFNDEKIATETLTVPHPYLKERAFVLVPLLEIEPGLSIDNSNTSLQDCLNLLDTDDIKKLVD